MPTILGVVDFLLLLMRDFLPDLLRDLLSPFSLPALRVAGNGRLRTGRLGVLITLAIAAVAGPLRAQQISTFDLAVYVPQPIQIAAERPLTFPRLVPGAVRTVSASVAVTQNGRFRITGAACAQIDVRFSLPSVVVGPEGATMPVDQWDGEWGFSTMPVGSFLPSPVPTRMYFDHSSTSCFTGAGGFTEDEAGTILVRIGGTVRAGANQRGGRYTSTLMVIINYVDL